MFVVVMHEEDVNTDQKIFKWIIASVIGILALTSVFSYVDFFAGTIYPIVPQQFGGGSPREVRLVVSNDSKILFGESGLNILETGIVSKPLDLLWETDQTYIVRYADDPDARILHVSKDSVAGLVGEPQYSGFSIFDVLPQPTPDATPAATP
jgi:hypothetical protein